MLIVDDILLFPIRGILWVFRELHSAAQKELAAQGDAITAELRELHMMLETKKITEEDFALQEKKLLDRLDNIQEAEIRIEAEDEEDEEQQGIHRTERTHKEAFKA